MRATVHVCLALVVLGVAWAVVSGLGGADALWVGGLGAPPSRIWPVTEGIWAGTVVGKWLMLAGVAPRVPRRALLGLLLADALADGALMLHAGLAVGALWGLPSLLVAALAGIDRPADLPARRGAAPWLSLACAAFLLVALVIGFGFHSPVFASYRQALHRLDPAPAWPWVELAYARIAVGFSVHYAALALALHHRGSTPALVRWAMAAQLGWFLTDSTTGLIHDAAFNVLMINVPAFLLFLVAWVVTWRAMRGCAGPG